MLHRNKLLLMLLVSGAYIAKPVQTGTYSISGQEGMYTETVKPKVEYAELYTADGEQNFPVVEKNYPVVEYGQEYQVAEYQKPTASKSKNKKNDVINQLVEAQKSDNLCPFAARLGRGLRVLPKTAGKINRKWLENKCGSYFLGDNEDGTIHYQAYAAVTNFSSMKKEEVEKYANKVRRDKGITSRSLDIGD